jgi:alpha-glucoside transport system permease protein
VSGGSISAEPPVVAAPSPGSEPGRWSKYLIGAIFLGPALFMLGLWMVYPVVYTIVRSFFGAHG